MKASDLKAAQYIVDALASIETMRGYTLAGKQQNLTVCAGRGEAYVTLPKDVAERAFELWRRSLDAREAELRRKAAQIGLVLS